jgi:hypothetical protein
VLIAGHGRPLAMLSAASTLLNRLAFSETISSYARKLVTA